MLVTLLGIVKDVRLQYLNARTPMLVTLLGIVTDVRPQPEKASFPMLVTLLGISMDVRPQPEKAWSPMLVTLLGIVLLLHPCTKLLVAVSIMALQPSRLSYFGFPSATTIEVIFLQFWYF